MRVMPPTRTTSLISAADKPASLRASRQGSIVFWTRSSTNASNFARVSFIVRCLAPLRIGCNEWQVDLSL